MTDRACGQLRPSRAVPLRRLSSDPSPQPISARTMLELAQAFATQLAGIDRINIIDVGAGGMAGGIGKVMSTVGGGMTAMLAMLKDPFGIDVASLAQAKTEAATAAAQGPAARRTAPDTPGAASS